MPEHVIPMPTLPCPSCGVNLLDAGFHNTCTETVSLREDNFTYLHQDRLYIDHDEKGHETVDHEWDIDAYCGSCHQLLPWALYEIRGLDGLYLSDAETKAAELNGCDKRPTRERLVLCFRASITWLFLTPTSSNFLYASHKDFECR